MEFNYSSPDSIIKDQYIRAITNNSKRHIKLTDCVKNCYSFFYVSRKNQIISRTAYIKGGVLAHRLINVELFWFDYVSYGINKIII